MTKKHYGLTPLFTKKIKGNIDIRVNFVYKYDEHELKVGSDLIKNFSIIIQEKLRIFNDSIKLARNLSPNRKIAVLTNKQATTVPPACKCYLVASVLSITSILHPNIVITSLGTASNSVAIELSLDSNLLPPLIAKGEQTLITTSFIPSYSTYTLISAATTSTADGLIGAMLSNDADVGDSSEGK